MNRPFVFLHPPLASSTAALMALMAIGALASPGLADGEPRPFRYEPEAACAQDAEAPAPAPIAPTSFEITGGAASDFSGVTVGLLQASWRIPVAEPLSVALFAEGLYASQDSGDATGFGGGLSLRWNFSRIERTDFYIDAGCGIAVFSDDVPEGGSTFNFTPRAMIGFSTELCDDARLSVQAGWLHISNAQTSSTNPGIDAIAILAGIAFEF